MDHGFDPTEQRVPAPSLSPPSSLPPSDNEFESVMALLQPKENQGCPVDSFGIGPGGGGLSLEEVPESSSPVSDTSSKDLDLDTGANGEGAGEIDEGFVEEFCDGEDILALPKDAENESSSELAQPDLDMHDIQHLLSDGIMTGEYGSMIAVPSSSFFDDFDLGVDVLDSEHSTHNLMNSPEPLKSPVAHVLGSPYHMYSAPSPVPVHSPVGAGGMEFPSSPVAVVSPVGMDLNSYNELLNQQMEGDLTGHFSEYGSAPSSSSMPQHGAVTHSDDLDMLCSVCDDFDTGMSLMTLRETQSSPVPSVDPANSPLPPHQNSLANFIMEHTQYIRLSELNQTDFRSLCSDSTPTTPVREKTFNFTSNGGGTLTSLGKHLLPKTNGIKFEEGTTGSCSRGSQTRQSCSPSPSPSLSPHISSFPLTPSSSPLTPTSCYHTSYSTPHTPSSCSSPAPSTSSGATAYGDATATHGDDKLPPTTKKLVDMPFYQFKKILDSTEVAEDKKLLAKNVRRRGKNKVAAKHCRQRKLDMICGLQLEIERLKAAKIKVEVKAQSLEREIEMLRSHCTLAERNAMHS